MYNIGLMSCVDNGFRVTKSFGTIDEVLNFPIECSVISDLDSNNLEYKHFNEIKINGDFFTGKFVPTRLGLAFEVAGVFKRYYDALYFLDISDLSECVLCRYDLCRIKLDGGIHFC